MVATRAMQRLAAGCLVALALVSTGTVQAQDANQVVCREDGGKRSYRLEFNWNNDTVTIASRVGNSSWKIAYKNATAVRNNASDRAFLAEGLPKQYVGAQTGCGQFVETWYFDVAKSGQSLKGVVERTPAWVATQANCKAKVPAPELATETVNVTCS